MPYPPYHPGEMPVSGSSPKLPRLSTTLSPTPSPADKDGPSNDLPDLVTRAMAAARGQEFGDSCSAVVGRLSLRLASQVEAGTIGEIGSGLGVVTAWLTSGLRPPVRLVTVESVPVRAAAVRKLFAGEASVEVLCADWRAILDHGPFALLFIDARPAKAVSPGVFLPAVVPGGTMVLDDLTPIDRWPPAWRGRPDPLRDAWHHHPGVDAEEHQVGDNAAVILARRRP